MLDGGLCPPGKRDGAEEKEHANPEGAQCSTRREDPLPSPACCRDNGQRYAPEMWLAMLLACTAETPSEPGRAWPWDSAGGDSGGVDAGGDSGGDSGRDSAADSGADSGAETGETSACPALGSGELAESSTPVIIGGGFAGLAAAIELGDAILLEASTALGGRGATEGNRRCRFVGTPAQEAVGEESSAAATFADWERVTGTPGTAETLAFLEASASVKARLEELGFAFDRPDNDFVTGRLELFRTLEEGPLLAQRFEASLPPGVDVRLGVAATGLTFDERGISGVETAAGVISTRRVLIASGGIAGRADVVASVSLWPLDTLTLANHPSEGWAFDLAQSLCLPLDSTSAIGAMSGRLGGMGDGAAGTFLGDTPVIWVGADGARFAMEGITGSVESETVWAAHAPAHVLTTAEAVRAGAAAGREDEFVAALRCYDSFNALAAAEGIDPAGVQQSLEEVERYRAGDPDPFGRASNLFPDLSGTPCAAEPGRVPQKTFGGLRVDSRGRALTAEGEIVQGLWVAGEAAGMAAPGLGGLYGFDGSLSAVVWGAWRAAAAMKTP